MSPYYVTPTDHSNITDIRTDGVEGRGGDHAAQQPISLLFYLSDVRVNQ